MVMFFLLWTFLELLVVFMECDGVVGMLYTLYVESPLVCRLCRFGRLVVNGLFDR